MYVDRLNLEVTKNCTLYCEHCLRGDKEVVNMKPELLDIIFKDVTGVGMLLLTGGEPLLAIQLLEKLAEILEQKDIKIDIIKIITNGTVFSGRIAKVLMRLKNKTKLDLRISDDIFHLLELDRLGLRDKREQNVIMMKNLLGATMYGEDVDINISRGLIKKGRALNLSQNRLDKINRMVTCKFSIDDMFIEEHPSTIYQVWQDRIYGVIAVSTCGKLVLYEQSYEEEKEYIDRNNLDISEMGFKNAAIQFCYGDQGKKLIYWI